MLACSIEAENVSAISECQVCPQVPLERMEADFWDIVENGEEPLDVLYGADLDTSVLGSGFPKPPGLTKPSAAPGRGHSSSTKQSKVSRTPAAQSLQQLTEDEQEYAHAPWNLNNLARHASPHSSLLQHLDDEVAGVVVPWLYIGMLFSSFCWHIEDHMLYSGAWLSKAAGKHSAGFERLRSV